MGKVGHSPVSVARGEPATGRRACVRSLIKTRLPLAQVEAVGVAEELRLVEEVGYELLDVGRVGRRVVVPVRRWIN